ncbi:MAG: PPC domain-containing protein, partial [Methanospirillaceae archaeon]|nr:PPC domain-containing protein [Methanospirillaceae archaeon]
MKPVYRTTVAVVILLIMCISALPAGADVGTTITKSAYLSAGSFPYQTQIQISSDARIDLYAPAGADFDLYAKQGGNWPSYTGYKYDYTIAETGPSQYKHMDVGPGLWYFSIDPVYGSGTFTFTAKNQQVSPLPTPPLPPTPPVTPVPTYQPLPGPCNPTDTSTKTGYLDQYRYDYYTFPVTSTRTDLIWQLFGPQNTRPVGYALMASSPTADADFNIYVSYNTYPTESRYDWADTSYGPDGYVSITSPKTGYYYVMVKSLKGSGSYQLNYQTFNCYTPTPTTTPVEPCPP